LRGYLHLTTASTGPVFPLALQNWPFMLGVGHQNIKEVRNMESIFRCRLLIIAVLVSFMVIPSLAQGQSIRERIQQRRESKQQINDTSEDSLKTTTIETIKVNGTIRNYRLHLPEEYDPNWEYPLVLSFHGLNSDAERQEILTGFSTLADNEDFIVVYPDGLEAKWRFLQQKGEDVQFVKAIIRELAEDQSIDVRRIYANGISNGAQMVWRLVCDKPQIFAAVGFVSGGYPNLPGKPRPPAIIFHGTKDRILPYDGRMAMMSVREFAQGWAESKNETGDIVLKKGEVQAEKWSGKRFQSILYTISGKGHSWPGSSMPERIATKEINASIEMWNFFKQFPASEQ
jgi:polyhydroxybutyrate depolymerase